MCIFCPFDFPELTSWMSSDSESEDWDDPSLLLSSEERTKRKGTPTTNDLLQKYSKYKGARTVVTSNGTPVTKWTESRRESLRALLQHWVDETSFVLRPLKQHPAIIGEAKVMDDCVRFTIEPFFTRIEPSIVAQIDREVRAQLPGFSFYIGNPSDSKSKKVRLIPPSGKNAFSVNVSSDTMQPYFEFRPTKIGDRLTLLGLLVLLFALAMMVAYSFYTSYSKEGYSLWTGIYEVLIALRLLG